MKMNWLPVVVVVLIFCCGFFTTTIFPHSANIQTTVCLPLVRRKFVFSNSERKAVD